MAFPQIPGRPPGEIRPLEQQVPDQGDVGPRAMLPLVPAREQQNHDVLQHAGLGHEQHDDDIDMNLENMLPLQQVFNMGQDDMLEDGNRQLREQIQCHQIQSRLLVLIWPRAISYVILLLYAML